MDNIVAGRKGENRTRRIREPPQMMTNFETQPFSLQGVLSNILISRQVTITEFNLLSLALLLDLLDDEDRRAVQRIFYALRRGWLTLMGISDEQSCAIRATIQRTHYYQPAVPRSEVISLLNSQYWSELSSKYWTEYSLN